MRKYGDAPIEPSAVQVLIARRDELNMLLDNDEPRTPIERLWLVDEWCKVAASLLVAVARSTAKHA